MTLPKLTMTLIAVCAALFFSAFADDASGPGPVVLIVNSGSALSTVAKSDARKLYLGKMSSVSGVKLKPAKPADEEIQARLRNELLGMSEKEEKTYWLKETFKGSVKFVKELPSEEKVIALVAKGPGTIGVISLKTFEAKPASLKKVKAIKVNDSIQL